MKKLLLAALLALAAVPATASAQYVEKAKCQPGDMVETGLQGQVPQADRVSGRSSQGYACNLRQIGAVKSHGWISLDTYGNCAYFSDTSGSVDTGTIVVDASDPTHPVQTDYLTASAMGNTWESMKVNAKRGLLAAGHDGTNHLNIYDVKTDCAHPKLLFDGEMPTGVGHEGTFSPDGLTYYMHAYGNSVSPIDVSDPAHPKELTQCVETWCQTHGGSISEDGKTGYFAEVNSPDGVAIVDTSDIQARKANPEIRQISITPLPWNAANQATIPLYYGDHQYLLSFGELTVNASLPNSQVGSPHCPTQIETNFDFPRILDIADPKAPKIVSKIMNEVDNPLNCPQVIGDNGTPGPDFLSDPNQDYQTKILLGALFVYDAHYCSVDRTHDPTLLGCAQSLSGVRFYDIRDPAHVKEIAYFNPGTVGVGDPTPDPTGARPIIRSDLGQVWMDSMQTGFRALKFSSGVWPFPDTPRCPRGYDPYLAHYDLTYERDCGYLPGAPAGTPVSPLAPRRFVVRARRVARRVLVRGKLSLPAGITAQTCRGGKVALRASGARAKTVRLNAKCTFKTRLKLKRGAGRRVIVRARFLGTNRLSAVRARPVKARRGGGS